LVRRFVRLGDPGRGWPARPVPFFGLASDVAPRWCPLLGWHDIPTGPRKAQRGPPVRQRAALWPGSGSEPSETGPRHGRDILRLSDQMAPDVTRCQVFARNSFRKSCRPQ
jgi:hypothetical protein